MCVLSHRNSIRKSGPGHKDVIRTAFAAPGPRRAQGGPKEGSRRAQEGLGPRLKKEPPRRFRTQGPKLQPALAVVMMRLAAVIGNDAVMAGEGQIVQLHVRTEDDALADGIDRSGTVERLGKSRARAVLAADLAIPLTAMVADTDRIATLQLADSGTVAVADVGCRPVADEVVHLIEVEHDVVGTFTSTID